MLQNEWSSKAVVTVSDRGGSSAPPPPPAPPPPVIFDKNLRVSPLVKSPNLDTSSFVQESEAPETLIDHVQSMHFRPASAVGANQHNSAASIMTAEYVEAHILDSF